MVNSQWEVMRIHAKSFKIIWKDISCKISFQFVFEPICINASDLSRHSMTQWVNLSGLLLHIFDTPEYCDVIKILSHTSITWSLNTVLWWRHNILKYRKYTELFHQRATHSYLIVCCSTAFTVVEWLLSWI